MFSNFACRLLHLRYEMQLSEKKRIKVGRSGTHDGTVIVNRTATNDYFHFL